MKKLLILLFSILISFNSYGEVELDFSLDSFCTESPKAQIRHNLFYLPNTQKPYSGENICVYLSNGQYYSQGDIKEGLRDGVWNFWYENGQIKSEGYYENGQIRSEKYYKDGELDGVHTEWYENGQKESEANYKNNKLNGKFNVWYENGQKKLVGNTRDDQYDGKQTIWHANGQMEGVANFKNGKQDGENTEWYENGQKKLEEIWKDGKLEVKLVFENDKLVGKTKYSYYPNGQMKYEENLYRGMLNGKRNMWHENGQKMLEGNFKNDNRKGKHTTWYENGQIESEGYYESEDYYKNDWKDGKWTYFYQNGQIKSEGNYKGFGMDGKWTNWYENGQIKSEEFYDDDKEDGISIVSTHWYENGNIFKVTKSNSQGNPVSETQYYASVSGQKKSELNYKNKMLDGKLTRWHDNGQIKSEVIYKDGKIVQKETLLIIPENAYISGSTWFCNKGYQREGNYCLKKPKGAYWETHGNLWKCYDGYKLVDYEVFGNFKSGGSCEKCKNPSMCIY